VVRIESQSCLGQYRKSFFQLLMNTPGEGGHGKLGNYEESVLGLSSIDSNTFLHPLHHALHQ
jgi:hypothetical protein